MVRRSQFVYGGKEDLKQGRSNDSKKKKIVVAVEKGKKIKINTNKWTGYLPLKQEYNITQTKSDKGNTFFEMNTIVHQVKAWLRSNFSWMHEFHIQKYLDEFSYRINRSMLLTTLFKE